MNFTEYMKACGSQATALAADFCNFPANGDWDGLVVFVNSHHLPDDVNSELEDLHDAYHLEEGGGNGEPTEGKRLHTRSKRDT